MTPATVANILRHNGRQLESSARLAHSETMLWIADLNQSE
jgi:hypothetical protein